MIPPKAKKLAGALVAAIALTMVTSVPPASAGEWGDRDRDRLSTSRFDSGWGHP